MSEVAYQGRKRGGKGPAIGFTILMDFILHLGSAYCIAYYVAYLDKVLLYSIPWPPLSVFLVIRAS